MLFSDDITGRSTFLKGNGGTVDIGNRRSAGVLRGMKGGEVMVGMYCMREE